MATRTESESFEQLLEHLRQTRGFDFAAYRRTSLQRRVLRRMQTVGISTFGAYLDYLELHQEEFAALFNTILINVTGFFRDPEVWTYLDTVVLPQLLEGRAESQPFRVWSAGSASGKEAYSVAMLLAEKIGIHGVRERAKIYATDVDEEALTEGRRAVFNLTDTEDLPAGFAERYFTIEGPTATLNRELRRAVMFGRLDLLQDAPISRIDLLLCRNTLMYFNAEAQTRILNRFSFSVDPSGFLVLGRAEMLFSHSAMFVPVDLQRRIFRVIGKANHRDRMGSFLLGGRDIVANGSSAQTRLRHAAFNADTTAHIVFGDSTSFHHLQAELNESKRKLEAAYDELQSTNEQLETTNEELQSTVEELETTNEELQLTNEELQTMNDELRTRSLEADLLSTHLESVFGNLRSAVVVLDRDYRIQVWNRRSEDLWGVRADEAIGAQFQSLDIGLPVGQLAHPIRSVMNGEQAVIEQSVPALTRSGKTIDCLVSVSSLRSVDGQNDGVIMLMDEHGTSGGSLLGDGLPG